MATKITTKHVETITHDEAKRRNIPSAEKQSFVQQEQTNPKQIRYTRNTDLEPQLVWRGKDDQDWSDLVVNAPPLYIQGKVHPEVLGVPRLSIDFQNLEVSNAILGRSQYRQVALDLLLAKGLLT